MLLRSRSGKPLFVTPGCCEVTRTRPYIILHFTEDLIYESPEGQGPYTPTWTMGYAVDYHHVSSLEGYDVEALEPDVKFCPFCGQPMPSIRKIENHGRPICSVKDGGYYCDTCGERLHSCSCDPMATDWEVVE